MSFMNFLTGFFLAGLGLFFLLKPEIAWELRHIFTVKNGEPTEFALWQCRLLGILLIAFTLFLTVQDMLGI